MDSMLSKALREFTTGPLNQLIVNLGGKNGPRWEEEFKMFLRGEPCWVAKTESKKQETPAKAEVSDALIAHPSLEFIREFPVEISEGFTVDTPDRKTYNYWNEYLTAKNFPQSSLQPGRRYSCEIYQLCKGMSSSDLVLAASSNGRVLGGALGIALISSVEYRSNLPEDYYLIGIDEEKNLWRRSSGRLPVPYCGRDGSGVDACLGSWGGDWLSGRYVVYFRDLGPCA